MALEVALLLKRAVLARLRGLLVVVLLMSRAAVRLLLYGTPAAA